MKKPNCKEATNAQRTSEKEARQTRILDYEKCKAVFGVCISIIYKVDFQREYKSASNLRSWSREI